MLEQTGPFEPEVSRLLTELRGIVGDADDFDADAATEAAADVVLSGSETSEAIKARRRRHRPVGPDRLRPATLSPRTCCGGWP